MECFSLFQESRRRLWSSTRTRRSSRPTVTWSPSSGCAGGWPPAPSSRGTLGSRKAIASPHSSWRCSSRYAHNESSQGKRRSYFHSHCLAFVRMIRDFGFGYVATPRCYTRRRDCIGHCQRGRHIGRGKPRLFMHACLSRQQEVHCNHRNSRWIFDPVWFVTMPWHIFMIWAILFNSSH